MPSRTKINVLHTKYSIKPVTQQNIAANSKKTKKTRLTIYTRGRNHTFQTKEMNTMLHTTQELGYVTDNAVEMCLNLPNIEQLYININNNNNNVNNNW